MTPENLFPLLIKHFSSFNIWFKDCFHVIILFHFILANTEQKNIKYWKHDLNLKFSGLFICPGWYYFRPEDL